MLLFQTFENIFMCLGIGPVMGLTLPLFSYGGSSVVTTYLAIGIVVGISQRSKHQRRHGLESAEELVVEAEPQETHAFAKNLKDLMHLPRKKK